MPTVIKKEAGNYSCLHEGILQENCLSMSTEWIFKFPTADTWLLSTFHFPATLITQKILWTRTTALILKFIIIKSIKMLYCRFSALVKYNSLNFHISKISFQHYKNSYAIIPTFIGWTFLSCGMHSDICLYLKKKKSNTHKIK